MGGGVTAHRDKLRPHPSADAGVPTLRTWSISPIFSKLSKIFMSSVAPNTANPAAAKSWRGGDCSAASASGNAAHGCTALRRLLALLLVPRSTFGCCRRCEPRLHCWRFVGAPAWRMPVDTWSVVGSRPQAAARNAAHALLRLLSSLPAGSLQVPVGKTASIPVRPPAPPDTLARLPML